MNVTYVAYVTVATVAKSIQKLEQPLGVKLRQWRRSVVQAVRYCCSMRRLCTIFFQRSISELI